MSTWWRTCQHCGETGTDARQCRSCGAFAPYASARTPYDDWRLAGGCLLLAMILAVAIVVVGAVVIQARGL